MTDAMDGARLDIEHVGVIDGTPLLDIKPYVPAFDARDDVRIGWYATRLDRVEGAIANDRFR
jgi:tRNA (adenine37-N6)-methyltransferase